MKEKTYKRFKLRLYRTIDELNEDFISTFLLNDDMDLIMFKGHVTKADLHMKRSITKGKKKGDINFIYNEMIEDFEYIIFYRNTMDDIQRSYLKKNIKKIWN